ncbi:PilN domain-containing protein [Roseateles albus]|uniref:PilN domain-containing protein n=1 Tax=Roseateles albus TaxID=2987525 RepID=A0ABT5KDV8_9BURK|nr:PilN domain-containing protein [Roseateles albus]MDC8771001.1 PilN domain-containing protein [Roseateles albus]
MAIRTPSATTWPQPDFMPAPQRPGVLMWGWLLISAAVLLALAWRWQDLQGQRGVLAEQAALLNKLAAVESRMASGVAPANAAELQRRAWGLYAQLQPKAGEDWASRWLALEQALPAGLQLQALEMVGAEMRLEGLAPSADLVMQLVDSLALQVANQQAAAAEARQEVVLTRLQRPEGVAEAEAGNALRFEVVRRRASALGQRS